ncbi:MAG: transglutaminase-like domain-containing protein [Acidimicrobiales bacterium]|nr:transglutaminase-like domain-containing protein [Acidimicrobiales bacterium]MDG2218797.1 transglutaminase-like domain-containing protein [Acidimicrobiales bacterium]
MDQSAEFVASMCDIDAPLRLDRVLLLLTATLREDPSIVEAGLSNLDRLAESCADHSRGGLVRHLFQDMGFVGDTDDYYDPDNSMLDVVLSCRRGMPITLAVVAIETGRRVGIVLDGIGMPGHFLVRDRDEPICFLDPFDGGVTMDRTACVARFHSIHGSRAAFDDRFLDPVNPRSIVTRVLNNLTASLRSRDPRKLDRLLALRVQLPLAPPELRALAELCERRGRFEDAACLLDRLAEATRTEAAAEHASRLRARLN